MASPRRDPPPLSPRQLLWLFAGTAATLLPLLPKAPLWLSAYAVALYLWRLAAWRLAWPLPKRPILLLLVGLSMAAVVLVYRTPFGREPGVALLVVFLVLKLMELRSARDAVTAVLLCYFLQLALFFETQRPEVALWMGANVLLITATLIQVNRDGQEPFPTLKLAGSMLVQSLPFMLALFLLFPRVEGPLWGMPRDAYSGRTGLSESMTPGSISELSLSGAIAFRVLFAERRPEQRQLYWRGPVLSRFDGRTWHVLRAGPADGVPYATSGSGVSYSLTLEPHNKPWLFALDHPSQVPDNATITRDYQLLANQPVRDRQRYDLRSHLDLSPGAEEAIGTLRLARALPPRGNPRARELARQWRERHADDGELVRAALDHFTREPFHYTLTPPALGEDAIDEFLFETRRGFCEHYAGAFVFLMRAAGIPARVVTGYQGGEYNPVDGYVVVRQSDAHAWAEVWLAGRGWRRIDPTAAVAPSRIERGLAAAMPADEPLPFVMRSELDWLRGLRYRWEALGNAWDHWVLGYNAVRQRDVLSRLGMRHPDWQRMSAVLAAFTGVMMLLLAAWTLRRRDTADAVERAWRRLSRRMARAGLPRHPWEGPLDYSRRAGAARPELAQELREIADLYARLRYGSQADRPAATRLTQRVRRFKPL